LLVWQIEIEDSFVDLLHLFVEFWHQGLYYIWDFILLYEILEIRIEDISSLLYVEILEETGILIDKLCNILIIKANLAGVHSKNLNDAYIWVV
jgi:hypothetical protein